MKTKAFEIIKPFFEPYRRQFFTAIFFRILADLMSVAEPFIFGLIITQIASDAGNIIQGVAGAGIDYQQILKYLILYVIRGFVFHGSVFSSFYFMTEANQQMIRDLRTTLIKKINRIPVSYFDRHQYGDILNRVTNDVETISNAFQQSLLQIISATMTITFVVIMMLVINLPLALLVILSLPLSFFVARKIMRKSQPIFREQANLVGDVNGYVQEHLTGFEVLKLFGREQITLEEFEEITEKLQRTEFKATFTSGLTRPVLNFISNLSYVLVAAVGGYLTIIGRLSVGNLQAFIQYVWQINHPIQMLTQIIGLVQSALAAIHRVAEILDEPEEVQSERITLEEPISGQVSFDDVSFQYIEDKPLIQNFNVNVKPGEMVAIVGPTGAGKTTLINLLMRFYDVNSGMINVDGMDIRQIDRQNYRSQFGMVLQDTWLFQGTIRDNLRFGNLNATDEQIIEAAEATNVDHFIRTLPHGYDMMIDQESSNISQGQKQLLTIARALLSDPQILILDEATSSVDTRMEKLIQEAMDRLMEGRTSFVIAHRLSTIQNASRILVMDQGQIIEQGNHDELMATEGFYYELYQSQFNQ